MLYDYWEEPKKLENVRRPQLTSRLTALVIEIKADACNVKILIRGKKVLNWTLKTDN